MYFICGSVLSEWLHYVCPCCDLLVKYLKSDIFQALLLQKCLLPHCKTGSSSIPIEKPTLLSPLAVLGSQLEGCDLSQLSAWRGKPAIPRCHRDCNERSLSWCKNAPGRSAEMEAQKDLALGKIKSSLSFPDSINFPGYTFCVHTSTTFC